MKTTLVAAISLDGRIAHDHQDQIHTSAEDKAYFTEITKRAGVIVCGNNTFKHALQNVPLHGRRTIVYTHNQDLLGTAPTPELEYTTEAPTDLLRRLADEGIEEVSNIGGEQIFTLFHNAGLVDEYHLTVSPQFVDGGIPMLISDHNQTLEITDRRLWNSGETLLVAVPKK